MVRNCRTIAFRFTFVYHESRYFYIQFKRGRSSQTECTIQTQTVQSQVRTSTAAIQQHAQLQQQPQQATVQQPQVGQPQPQQIRLATAGAQPAQQLVTLAGGQQIAVQMQPQVMQFPAAASTQQTMMQTVQIPVSQVCNLSFPIFNTTHSTSYKQLCYLETG